MARRAAASRRKNARRKRRAGGRRSWGSQSLRRLGDMRELGIDRRQKVDLVERNKSGGGPDGQRCARHNVPAACDHSGRQGGGIKVNGRMRDGGERHGRRAGWDRTGQRAALASGGRATQAERKGEQYGNNRNGDVPRVHRAHYSTPCHCEERSDQAISLRREIASPPACSQ